MKPGQKERRKADIKFSCCLDTKDEGQLMEREEKPCFITCTKTEQSSCHDRMSAFSQQTEYILLRVSIILSEKRRFIDIWSTLDFLPYLNGCSAVAELMLPSEPWGDSCQRFALACVVFCP